MDLRVKISLVGRVRELVLENKQSPPRAGDLAIMHYNFATLLEVKKRMQDSRAYYELNLKWQGFAMRLRTRHQTK